VFLWRRRVNLVVFLVFGIFRPTVVTDRVAFLMISAFAAAIGFPFFRRPRLRLAMAGRMTSVCPCSSVKAKPSRGRRRPSILALSARVSSPVSLLVSHIGYGS